MKKNLLTALLIIIATLVVSQLYFHSGFPYTHDGENHLARFANYISAVREFQLPPRFAPNLFNHYGYPVFNFNYPLANILSVPFSLLKLNYELTFKLIVIMSLIFGMTGAQFWLRKLQFSTGAQRFALMAFAVNSYLVSTIYFRGNIGEVMALCLFPWLFGGVEKCRESRPFTLLEYFSLGMMGAAFLLAHNIAAVFGCLLLIGYAAFRLGKDLHSWKKLISLFLCAMGLSLWFWLPALMEKSFTVVDQANVNESFNDHFPTFTQLLFSPLTFGFSFPGPIDSLSFSLGMVQVITFFFGLVLAFKVAIVSMKERKLPQRIEKIFLFLVTLSLLLFILQLSITAPIWHVLAAGAKYLQFPWRLSLFLQILLLPVTAYVFQHLRSVWKFFLIGVLLLQFGQVLHLRPADYFHHDVVDYDFFAQSTSTSNENRSKTFTYNNIADWKPTPLIFQGKGEAQVQYWRGSRRRYTLQLTEESVIIEPTMNFPGWITYVHDEQGKRFSVPYIDSESIGGRLAYILPAGTYQVQSTFTQWTWPRVVGNTVSAGTALGLMGFFVYSMVRRRTYDHA
jgi:hypothetical protein